MAKDVIIACDFSSKEETLEFLSKFGETKPFVKIGMELFYAEGPEIVKTIKDMGHRIFLDLKLHDIPNTVGSAIRVLDRLGVDMCNVHVAGASRMMKAAADSTSGLVIGVTQLTSTSQEVMEQEILIDKPLQDVVIEYAKNAKASGLGGVVCSPLEAKAVHEACGDDFLTVTPGIRFAEDAVGDQVRVTTPAMAREIGSDYIVVGRSITKAADPVAAYEKCRKEFLG